MQAQNETPPEGFNYAQAKKAAGRRGTLMPKRITILDPNGVEVAPIRIESLVGRGNKNPWHDVIEESLEDFEIALKRENPKLGTYTVTVKEVE